MAPSFWSGGSGLGLLTPGGRAGGRGGGAASREGVEALCYRTWALCGDRKLASDQPTKHCPSCAEEVQEAAVRCKHCGHLFVSAEWRAHLQAYGTMGSPERAAWLRSLTPDQGRHFWKLWRALGPEYDKRPAVARPGAASQELASKSGRPRRVVGAWPVILIGVAVLAIGVASVLSRDPRRGGRDTVSEPAPAPAPATKIEDREWRTDYRSDIIRALNLNFVRECEDFQYAEESTNPPTYLVQCLSTGDTFHVVPLRGEVTSTVKIDPPERSRRSTSAKANPEDLRQARRFLADLPQACNGSHRVAADRTVILHYSCSGNGKSARGEIRIKDGIVTGLR